MVEPRYGGFALMELYIETLTGVLMELIVHPYETIYNVKAKIQKLEGFPISEQHLIWQAMELENEMSLQHYRIPDGATLRLVLNMRGGPVNTRRVPLEESSLREMAEYFSDPIGDDNTSGDRPVTVIVYQQGDHINFFRLVDRDTSSSLSYSISGGSDFNGEDDSPIPKDRQEENEKTRNKMKMLKEQMENLTLLKQSNVPTRRGHVPRPPSSGRAHSRAKLRHIPGENGRPVRLLNKNACLPPVEQQAQPAETSGTENAPTAQSLLSDLPSKPVPCSSASGPSLVPQKLRGLVEPKPLSSINETHSEHSELASVSEPTLSSSSLSALRSATVSHLPTSVSSHTEAAGGTYGLSDRRQNQQQTMKHFSGQSALHSLSKSAQKITDVRTRQNEDERSGSIKESKENASGKLDCSSSELLKNSSQSDTFIDGALTKDPGTSTGNHRRPGSKKSSRHAPAQLVPHPPPASSRYMPFPATSSSRLLPQRHSPDAAKNGYGDASLPAEAVLRYLMSPTAQRSGTERKTSGVKLQSLNHKEVRAMSGMLRDIVRSSNRSRTGYVVTSGKLVQMSSASPPPPTDPTTILRLLSGGSRDGRATPSRATSGRVTPGRVRLPSVKVTKKKAVKRCAFCKKRTKLSTGFQCRCGENFCLTHLCAEAHGCTYDYKAEGRKLIEQSNPVVTAPKLPKI